jgi:Spy/CpxP family protein refolding chaperone
MTTRTRIALGIGTAAVALVVSGVGYQNISAQGPVFGGPDAHFQQGPGGPGQGGAPGGLRGRRGGPGMGPGGPGLLGPALRRLELTEDQRSRVRQITESHRDEQRAIGDRARKAHEALREVTESPTFDESAVRARAADVASVEADMAVARARLYNEVYQILTPEQQTTLKTLQAERGQRQERVRERVQERRERRQR